jgi:rhamnogalacturonan endolyase
MVDEQTSENNGIASHFQDAKDGTIIWEDKQSGDNGRGCAGPLIAGTKGWQFWSGSGGLYDTSQKVVGSKPGSTNFTIWWGPDLNRFLEDGTSITPYGSAGGTGLSASGCSSNNTSKSTPALTADIFGDWREEVVYRTSGNDALRIYTTTQPTTNRLYTLMHDPIYRMSVATENVAYNQPPEPGIYIGPGMTLPETQPKIKYYGTGGSTGSTGGSTGTTSTGGSTGSTGGSTGTTSTGGSTGATGTGGSTGTTSTGGSTGTTSTGGKGGATPGTGGTAGGVTTIGTGGVSSGGIVGSGGAAKGGAIVSGGVTSSGGIVASSGGIVASNGGAVTTGGTTSNAPSGGSTANSTATGTGQSGCGCRLGGADRGATLWGAMLAFGALVTARLRRRGKGPSRLS